MELLRFPPQVLSSSVTAQRTTTTEVNVASFHTCPVEILDLIFQHISIFDACALALTCRRFAAVVLVRNHNHNHSLTWHHEAGTLLQPQNSTWFCAHGFVDNGCRYSEPATGEVFSELLRTLPCVRDGFKRFAYFMDRFWPDVPAWVELRYCARCVEFRPRVCLGGVVGDDGPGNGGGDCVQVGGENGALVDACTLDWTNRDDPVWSQKPAARYEPCFRGGLWYMEEIPRHRWGVAQVCPACRDENKKPQAASEEEDGEMFFRLTKRTDNLGLRRLLGNRRMQPEKDTPRVAACET